MSPSDRWNEINLHLEEVADHLRAIRGEAEPWARFAIVQHEERVHRLGQKLQAARKVLGQ